jgi:hypothetical protein
MPASSLGNPETACNVGQARAEAGHREGSARYPHTKNKMVNEGLTPL